MKELDTPNIQHILHRFYTTDTDTLETVLDKVEWSNRHVLMKDKKGNTIFEGNFDFPISWSDTAVNITASKYFYLGKTYQDTSLKTLITRVVNKLSEWFMKRHGYDSLNSRVAIFRAELSYILLHQLASFNSPVWFNLGIPHRKQVASACYIVGIEDDMENILEFGKTEGKIFNTGAGSGANFSKLRGSMEPVKGGGVASGPTSFMKTFDVNAGVIRSAGILRRAAKLCILDVDHPDIEEFITSKTKEEDKARALVKAGYSSDIDGEAYSSVFFQNQNNSVMVNDIFMRLVAARKKYNLYYRKSNKIHKTIAAKQVLTSIAKSAWNCGCPGIVFKNTINKYNTLKNSGEIRSGNPCLEVLNFDDTACNLASINVGKLIDDRVKTDHINYMNMKGLPHIINIVTLAQDAIIDYANYPNQKITTGTTQTRGIGLGITNLGSLLMKLAIPYDSEEGRLIAVSIMSTILSQALEVSMIIGTNVAPFPLFKKNRQSFTNVLFRFSNQLESFRYGDTKTTSTIHKISVNQLTKSLKLIKYIIDNIQNHGAVMANSYVNCCPPAGTISFMMDCQSTGIEPILSLVQHKKLVGGTTIKTVNKDFIQALKVFKYSEEKIKKISNYVEKNETIYKCPDVYEQHYSVFATALGPKEHVISPAGHIDMVAALQSVTMMSISKTVNISNDCTVNDIEKIFIEAWEKGLKCITVYRDGCKISQPLSTKATEKKTKIIHKPIRKPLPDTRPSITHKFSVSDHDIYITVGLYDNGNPGEIFIRMAKVGSFVCGIVDSFATQISIALQYGVPLQHMLSKLKNTRFDPCGMTSNKEIQFTSSILDYIARWMEKKFIKKPKTVGQNETENVTVDDTKSNVPTYNICRDCGGILFKSGSCEVCSSCGSTTGCS